MPPARSLGRRTLIGGAAGIATLAGGGLVLRNQITHPHRDKTSRPDGRFRRLTLSCTHPLQDPVLSMAIRGGFLARYNLEVTLLPGSASGQEALDAMASGHADVTIAPALSWLTRQLAGLDARMIAGLQSGSARLLVDRKSPIKRIEDLHRHTIGIADAQDGPRTSADRLFFSIVMRRKGMNPAVDVAWTSVAPEQFGSALAGGRIQAVVGHDPVIWEIRERLHLVELASSMTGSYGTRVSRVLGVRGDLLRADPDLAVSLSLAFRDAAESVAQHLDATASMLADQLPDMSVDAVDRMLHAEGHLVHPTGKLLRDQIAQYIDELKLLSVVAEDQNSGALARQFCATVLHA